jgi:hypothetical protein
VTKPNFFEWKADPQGNIIQFVDYKALVKYGFIADGKMYNINATFTDDSSEEQYFYETEVISINNVGATRFSSEITIKKLDDPATQDDESIVNGLSKIASFNGALYMQMQPNEKVSINYTLINNAAGMDPAINASATAAGNALQFSVLTMMLDNATSVGDGVDKLIAYGSQDKQEAVIDLFGTTEGNLIWSKFHTA